MEDEDASMKCPAARMAKLSVAANFLFVSAKSESQKVESATAPTTDNARESSV
eukprot:CAMPEP_0172548618 /NCGR_PEP_ID=MMETSP1067-20121228/17863_1 /TAXON_ID=265564 ORGANISM="Thalassiosira punctigera, Strain Tpunct2005C2" /NCGR_SAMPLE_ID=MMETSP1067 /ASSEMBLY_ACC=CAM_ASM_000444 /LENGTH=52 /DNA_ID=CAMNT_0013335855 /DNA_START=566 /DNA_END=724 /DNA_ORIENTATION=-